MESIETSDASTRSDLIEGCVLFPNNKNPNYKRELKNKNSTINNQFDMSKLGTEQYFTLSLCGESPYTLCGDEAVTWNSCVRLLVFWRLGVVHGSHV